MRRFLLAAAATIVVATPAVARDGSGYVGVDGGALFPHRQHIDGAIDFTNANSVDFANSRVARVKFKTGYDVDLNAGYDFGLFRIEGELGYKRASMKDAVGTGPFLTALNGGSGQTFTSDDLFGRHVSALSGMVNGLVDFGGDSGFSGFGGAGFGRARVKEFGDSDSAWAWQVLAGVKTALSDNIDVGLKYRYFHTGHLNFDDSVAFTGVGAGSGGVFDIGTRTRFMSHSVL